MVRWKTDDTPRLTGRHGEGKEHKWKLRRTTGARRAEQRLARSGHSIEVSCLPLSPEQNPKRQVHADARRVWGVYFLSWLAPGTSANAT